MNKFSIHLSQYIPHTTKHTVFELLKNEISLFEEFVAETEKKGNYSSDLARLIRIIENSANDQRLPATKFKELKHKKLKDIKLYEAKAGDLRVYLFKEDGTGRIIVTGGIKGNQQKDINKTVEIINTYSNEK